MIYYFITGSSKGLGKSLLDLLLKEDGNFVYGFARTNALKHKNYQHKIIDLSNVEKVKNYTFPTLENPEKIILINNAGIVGDINHVGKLDNQKIIECYNLNLIAPTVLTNNFISKYSHLSCEKMVLNISSGAGKSPVDGWNVYCSSKAGIDMFSQVLKEEVEIDKTHIKVLSLAPGIIDTEMQAEIRSSKKSSFSSVERFIVYNKNGDLVNPSITAQQVLRFIDEEELQNDVICTVRDL